MKNIIFIIFLLFSTNVIAEKDLVGKVIWCSFSNDEVVALIGYKFLNYSEYEMWHQSSIVPKNYSNRPYTSNFNYIFLYLESGIIRINRTTLEFTAKDLTLNDGKNCEVVTPKSDDFEKLFDLKYAQILNKAKKLKKL
jgi:hypothetical protein